MSDVVWETSHSVVTRASPDFAFRYWTEVKNWDDPPARFEFEGPFVAGARGLTHLPGQAPVEWFVRAVETDAAATVEIPADEASMSFEWKFEPAGECATQLTQRITLRGRKAENYLSLAKMLEENLPLGMNKMASAIELALAESCNEQR